MSAGGHDLVATLRNKYGDRMSHMQSNNVDLGAFEELFARCVARPLVVAIGSGALVLALAAAGIACRERSRDLRRLAAPFDRGWRYLYRIEDVLL